MRLTELQSDLLARVYVSNYWICTSVSKRAARQLQKAGLINVDAWSSGHWLLKITKAGIATVGEHTTTDNYRDQVRVPGGNKP